MALLWLPMLEGAAKKLMIAELSRRLDAQVKVASFKLFLMPPGSPWKVWRSSRNPGLFDTSA